MSAVNDHTMGNQTIVSLHSGCQKPPPRPLLLPRPCPHPRLGLHFMPGLFCLEAVSVQAVFMCHAEERKKHRASIRGDRPPPQSWDLRAEPAFPTCLWDEAGAAPRGNERARGSLEAFGDWVVWVVGGQRGSPWVWREGTPFTCGDRNHCPPRVVGREEAAPRSWPSWASEQLQVCE